MNRLVLPGMSPVYENMARSVVQAHKKINGQNTAPTGTISFTVQTVQKTYMES